MTRVAPQRLVFSYHKTGTSLFLHVMTKVAARLGIFGRDRTGPKARGRAVQFGGSRRSPDAGL